MIFGRYRFYFNSPSVLWEEGALIDGHIVVDNGLFFYLVLFNIKLLDFGFVDSEDSDVSVRLVYGT